MFRKPVVFIVGAGASKDYGLPLGGELASTIAADVKGLSLSIDRRRDTTLYDLLLNERGREALTGKYVPAGQRLAAVISSSVSVDDALYRLSENPEAIELGKICIFRAVLKAEGESSLSFSPDTGKMRPDAGMDGWIEQFFSMATEDCRLSEVPDAFDKVTFVNFNYDRCIEHYLYWSLQRIGISEGDAADTVRRLASSMIRPYGTLGSIIPRARDFLAFGADTRIDVASMLSRIRTYTESDALHDPAKLESALNDAAMFIFLGFGFHRQNMNLLTVRTVPAGSSYSKCLATVIKINPQNLRQLNQSIVQRFRLYDENSDLVVDLNAKQLLSELRLRIMMAVG